MTRFSFARSASLFLTLFGVLTNLALAFQILSAWKSLRRSEYDSENEWERESAWGWKIDGLRVLWGLLSVYFASTATVCAAGFVGVVRNKPSFVRFYRDYSIADFAFSTLFTLAATYGAFRTSARTNVCEELSRQPELMRDVAEIGLTLENCERWFEQAIIAFLAVMLVITVLRLHFLLAVSNYYSQLTRYTHNPLRSSSSISLPSYHSHSHSHSSSRQMQQMTEPLQRIYLLPLSSSSSSSPPPPIDAKRDHDMIVYAPVPFSSLSAQDAESATEAWVSRSEPTYGHRYRSHGRTTAGGGGGISLPIWADEGLGLLAKD